MRYRTKLRLREAARVVELPPLARALVGEGKARGWRRLRRKTAQLAFELIHQRVGVPARGRIAIAVGAAWRNVEIDAANTAFIALAETEGRGGFEPALGAFMDIAAAEARVVYDIGANWGAYTLRFAGNPEFHGEIHSFEPAPRTAAGLAAIVARSGLADRITVRDIAISDRDGETGFVIGRHSVLARIDPSGSARVATRRLDTLDLPAPDLVKIDVEGHEAAVLRGGAALIDRARPIITLESWRRPDDPGAMLAPLRFLADRGYELFRLLWEAEIGGRPAFMLEPPVGIGADCVLALVPMAVEERGALPYDFDVAAIPPGRIPAAFERA
jgi:FkbM family methyltransferase